MLNPHIQPLIGDSTMTQVIVTKYIGPRGSHGSRIKATTSSGISITRGYNPALSCGDANQAIAARALAEKLGWCGRFVAGCLNDHGDLVFVNVAAPADAEFTIEQD
jgi:hypothetical protein